MVSSTNRNTQVDIQALTDHASSPELTKEAVLIKSQLAKPDSAILAEHRDANTNATQTRIQSTTTKTVTKNLRQSWESPWHKYDMVYDLELGGTVKVAVRKHDPIELVHMKTFEIDESAEMLWRFRKLQHQNLVTAIEAFTTDSNLYIILEHMPISLDWIVRSPAYPNDPQLAAILEQVSAGNALEICAAEISRPFRNPPCRLVKSLVDEETHSCWCFSRVLWKHEMEGCSYRIVGG